MKQTTLGHSGLEVSRLCLGCMSFGNKNDPDNWVLDEASSDAIIKHALDLGINFFDTANVYSGGVSEDFTGRILKKYVKREDVIIASKVYNNEGRLSKEAIEREIEGTLKRLGTDYLDLYIIHRFDYEHPMEETMEALHKLVQAGKVRALGASAMYGYQFYNLQMIAEREGWTPFTSMQNHYNLLYREDEHELIPICKQMNVALTPYSPLAAGRVARPDWEAGTKRSQADTFAGTKYDSTREADQAISGRVKELADKHDTKMAAIALAWHFAKGIHSPVIGVTKKEHLDDAAAALNIQLTKDEVTYLDELYVPHRIMGAIPPPEAE